MSSGPSSSRSTTSRRRVRSPTAPSSGPGPPGGGAVVAAQLLKLAGACDFYTALGEDDAGRRSLEQLEQLGLVVHPQWFGSTRRALTHVDQDKERTITTVGPEAPAEGPVRPRRLRRRLLHRRRRRGPSLGASSLVPGRDAARARDAEGGRRPPRPARRERDRSRRALRRQPRRRRRLRHRGRPGRRCERRAATPRRRPPGRSRTPTEPGIRSQLRSVSRLRGAIRCRMRSALAAAAGAAVVTGRGPYSAQITL